MLELERQEVVASTPRPTRPHLKRAVDEVVREKLLSGDSILKSAMVSAAADEGHESPARSVNIILMGYLKRKLVTRTDDDTRYSVTEKGKSTLSEKAEGAQ